MRCRRSKQQGCECECERSHCRSNGDRRDRLRKNNYAMPEINVEALLEERLSHWEEISRKHFPESEDLSLVVAKTHLILEQHLTALIAHYCPRPRFLPDARLKFSQKLYLVRALVLMPINDEIWAALKLLNTIRNDLAHNLEPPKLADHLSSAKTLAISLAKLGIGPRPPSPQMSTQSSISQDSRKATFKAPTASLPSWKQKDNPFRRSPE
jgi:hypothetical protein